MTGEIPDQQRAGERKAEELLPPGCGLWFGWFLASIFGTFAGWIIGWRISYLVPGVLSTLMLGATIGLILGSLQWLVLRGHIKAAGWWVLASALGWGVGLSLGAYLAGQFGLAEIGFGLMIGGVIGLSTGIFQWMVLRRHVPNASWWLPASIFAWTSSLVYYQPGATWLGAYYGTLSGMVTGLALLWLLYRPVAEDTRSSAS